MFYIPIWFRKRNKNIDSFEEEYIGFDFEYK